MQTKRSQRRSLRISKTPTRLERVEELEKQLTSEEADAKAPLAKDVETATREQIDRHEATHTPYKMWCK